MIIINTDQLEDAILSAMDEAGTEDTLPMDNHIDLMEVTGLPESDLMWGKPDARDAVDAVFGYEVYFSIIERDSFGPVCSRYSMYYQGIRLTWTF